MRFPLHRVAGFEIYQVSRDDRFAAQIVLWRISPRLGSLAVYGLVPFICQFHGQKS